MFINHHGFAHTMAKNDSHQKIARQHVSELFPLVKKYVYAQTSRASSYASQIRQLAMRFRLRLSREVKRSYCKYCYVALAPGQNCRVRTRNGKLICYCFSCKKTSRLPIGTTRGKN